eukprot:629127-Pyramimonas_sp.AAC.1
MDGLSCGSSSQTESQRDTHCRGSKAPGSAPGRRRAKSVDRQRPLLEDPATAPRRRRCNCMLAPNAP